MRVERTEEVPFSALEISTRSGLKADAAPLPSGDRRTDPVTQLVASTLILPIQFYQRFIPSRFKRKCLYLPSCSQYAIAAIRAVGPAQGIRAAWSRIRRCNIIDFYSSG